MAKKNFCLFSNIVSLALISEYNCKSNNVLIIHYFPIWRPIVLDIVFLAVKKTKSGIDNTKTSI